MCRNGTKEIALFILVHSW